MAARADVTHVLEALDFVEVEMTAKLNRFLAKLAAFSLAKKTAVHHHPAAQLDSSPPLSKPLVLSPAHDTRFVAYNFLHCV